MAATIKNFLGGGTGQSANIYIDGLLSTDNVSATNPFGNPVGVVWGSKPNPAYRNLPQGFTQVEYIQSSGTEWINTGININSSYSYKFKCTLLSGSLIMLCGVMHGDCFYENGVLNGRMGTNLTKVSATLTDYEIELSHTELKINGTSTALSGSLSVYNYPVGIFCRNGDYFTCAGSKRIEYFEIYNGVTLVADFIPCLNDTTGKYGMYDLVSNTFFGNSGSGDFSAGNIVPSTLPCWHIKAKDFGNYTISAVRGSKTISQVCLVDVLADYEVEMSFRTYLFKTNEIKDCSNTWKQNNRTITISDEKIYAYASTFSYSWGVVCSTNQIDLSQYTKLYLDFSNTSDGTSLNVILRDSQPTSQPDISDAIASYSTVSRSENYIDISSYTATKYIALCIHEASTLNIYNIWLE